MQPPATPNGFFSEDSYTSGTPEEYYLANDQVYQGEYVFLANYWLDGQCMSAVAHLFIFYPGASDWMELTPQNTGLNMQWPSPQVMNFGNPYPKGACADLLCLNNYTDWWVPDAYFSAKVRGAIEIAQGLNRTIGSAGDMLIFRPRMEIPSPAKNN